MNTTVGFPMIFGYSCGRKKRSLGFPRKNPLEGYRRLAFLMLDADVVAVSPSNGWRVLLRAGLLSWWKRKLSRKGTGFELSPHAHQHWHIDVLTSTCVARSAARHAAFLEAKVDELTQLAREPEQTPDEQRGEIANQQGAQEKRE
jgi:hypothetical protein